MVPDTLKPWLAALMQVPSRLEISPWEVIHHQLLFVRGRLIAFRQYKKIKGDDIRTHRSLDKDAPVSRPVQRTGAISSHAILGGLHHHYVRI